MVKNIKASIIITNYNYSKYLARCLRSCFNQSLIRDLYEIILIDDCSTDNSIEIAETFKDERNFYLIKNNENLGVAASANKGILKSKAEFIVRVDADDFVSNDFLRFLVFYLEDNKSAFCVSCDYHYVDENENKYKRIKYDEIPVSCGVMYRKNKLIELGMYNEEFKHREEEELRARLGSLYKIQNLGISLYRYRKHDTNKTKQLKHMMEFKQKLFSRHNISKETNNDKDDLDFPVAIIPARLGSQRLKEKNIQLYKNKPLIYWAIQAAKNSKYIKKIFVSSESKKILDIAKEYGVETIERPDFLSEPDVYKMDAIIHAVNEIKKFRRPTIISSIQANSPEINSKAIDDSINQLLKFNLNEVMSVDENLNQNGAIRTMKYKTVFDKNLSTHFGIIKTYFTDIHTAKDLEKLNEKK
tara:strand:+ start:2243 stop:3487 length:1245 start_codon:yes stop_codon:yes gene_type:complete